MPKATVPTARMIAVVATARINSAAVLPDMYSSGSSGVPRKRLRTSRSRRPATALGTSTKAVTPMPYVDVMNA